MGRTIEDIRDVERTLPPKAVEVLEKQLLKIQAEETISILCTCVFYIVEYNPNFIHEMKPLLIERKLYNRKIKETVPCLFYFSVLDVYLNIS